MEYIAKLEQEPTVSLNIDQRRLRQKEAESMSLIGSVDDDEESAERDKNTFAQTFYNKEIVHMTIDYIEELAKG